MTHNGDQERRRVTSGNTAECKTHVAHSVVTDIFAHSHAKRTRTRTQTVTGVHTHNGNTRSAHGNGIHDNWVIISAFGRHVDIMCDERGYKHIHTSDAMVSKPFALGEVSID